ncbi:MAG TPA: hypothetical protein VFS15_08025 [Kofleriaceae bacterium]|nr:hypothetical protein [Kofleriaceae bacterium]
MIRVALLMVAVAAFGCSKPSEEDCRKAIANMQRLMGTENLRDAATIEGDVRRCKGGSHRKAVKCAIDAKTLDDLRHCDFFKVPENAPGIGSDTGSAAGSASGSAAGSASGSAAGSASGSAADSAAGSATGSADAPATGSATGGAATGSAAGSAAPPAAGSTAGSAQ